MIFRRTLSLWLFLSLAHGCIPLTVCAETPPVEKLRQVVQEAYAKFKDDKSGKNADYIPALASVPSDLFGVVIVTASGEVVAAGDAEVPFSIQSCSKVFTMCQVMQESGSETIASKVNVEPTGEAFNSVRAIEEGDGRADNPLVNAGAIAIVSMVNAGGAADRWAKILGTLNRFAGEELSVLDEIYESEAATNFRNRGIAHLLFNSSHLFCDPLEAADVYTRQCSVGVTARQLGMMGATLANAGVNPRTQARVLDAHYVPEALSVMMMNGFYDGSGSWAWRTGVPAKTGVGGGIFAVVPGRMCIVGFAPPLDAHGNSVRAQKAIEYIVRNLSLNLFEAVSPPPAPNSAPPSK